MGDNPPNTPPTGGDPTADEEAKFRGWFQKYLSEHEPSSPSSQGGQPQGGSTGTFEQAIEAVLTRRERRQNSEKRVKDLETSNGELKTQIDELKKTVADLGKGAKRSIFSIFD